MKPLFFLLLIFSSCTVPDKASLAVHNQTRKARKSPAILVAEGREGKVLDYLELRENNSFGFRTRESNRQKVIIYEGTFERTGDELTLSFINNRKDEMWTDKAIIDKATNTITIIGTDKKFDRPLLIRKMKMDW